MQVFKVYLIPHITTERGGRLKKMFSCVSFDILREL